MFLPVIMDPFSFNDYRYRWQFQKFLWYSFQNGIPLIAQERFRNNMSVFSEQFKRNHRFEMLSDEQMESMEIYYVPEEIFNQLISEKGSNLAAKVFLLNNRYPPLEECLDAFLDKVSDGYELEGLIFWAAQFESVRYLARKHGIKSIILEYSVRFPNYYPLCYFCFDDIYEYSAIRSGLEEFRFAWDSSYELLSKKEILTLLLDDTLIDYIDQFSAKASYEMGVAGCHPIVTTFFAKSMFTDIEITQEARRNYDEENILFRKHPGEEPYQADYGFHNQDTSSTPIPFLLKCRRVAAQGSNILYEAMLWDKMVYSHDVSPFAQFCEHDFSVRQIRTVPEDLINYATFGYFVPFDLVLEPEYMRWRCKNPPVIEIFERNLNLILQARNIPHDTLYLPKDERLSSFMRARTVI